MKTKIFVAYYGCYAPLEFDNKLVARAFVNLLQLSKDFVWANISEVDDIGREIETEEIRLNRNPEPQNLPHGKI